MAATLIMELHPASLSGQTLVSHKQSDTGVGMCLSLPQKQLLLLYGSHWSWGNVDIVTSFDLFLLLL